MSQQVDQKHLDSLAYDFFKLFAQFEAKLKEQGFVCSIDRSKDRSKDNGSFAIKWDEFANRVIGPDFRNKLGEHVESAEYLLNDPPMKQIYKNGCIEWDPVANGDRTVQGLFGHLRRVRNNLFHGAKFGTLPDTWDKPERSEKLLKAALRVLSCLKEEVGLNESEPRIL